MIENGEPKSAEKIAEILATADKLLAIIIWVHVPYFDSGEVNLSWLISSKAHLTYAR